MTRSYIDIMNEEFLKRKNINSSYSVRAFANSLNVHPATLSHILNKKRNLPLSKALTVASQLGLKGRLHDEFMQSIYKTQFIKLTSKEVNKKLIDEIAYESFVVNWKYPLILCLLETAKPLGTIDWLSQKSSIPYFEVFDILADLETLELVRQEKGKYFSTGIQTKTTSDRLSLIIIKAHKNSLAIAKERIEQVNVNKRDYRFNTMSINPKKIPEYKSLVKEFIEKTEELLEDNETTEVYRLAIQLFPLADPANFTS